MSSRSSLTLIPAVALLATTVATAIAQAAPEPRSELGKGILTYDRDAGVRDECIRFDADRVVEEDVRLTSYELTLVKNKEELSDRISFSASAKGSYGVFSAGAKSRFVREIEWNQNSNYVLVRATRITRRQTLNLPTALLTNHAGRVLRDSRFDFLRACGNAYATAVEMGGEIYGLVEIRAESYEEKQRIEMAISGSGSFTGGKASGKADYERTIRRLSAEYRAKVTFQHIGGGTVEVPNDAEGLLQLSNDIERLSDAHPVPLNLITRDYSTVSNYPSAGTIGVDEKLRQNQLDWARSRLAEARDLYARILYVLENPRDFKDVRQQELKRKLTYLDEKILELKNFVDRGSSFLFDVDTATLRLDLSFELPSRKWRAGRRPLRVTCETRPSPICGVAEYREQKTSACGVVGPLTGTGPVCGTTYREAPSASCGVKTYRLGRGPACGIALYKQCHANACGKKPMFGGRRKCRTSACGVELFNECRDPSFGVEAWNSCRHPLHGVESHGTCQDKEFGYEFASCRHFSHGPDRFESCEVAKIGNQETFCPKF